MSNNRFQDSDLQPRATRKRKRTAEERGLPPDAELTRLADLYLEIQHRHWPKLVKSGLLPQQTPQVLKEMVANYKNRHKTGHVNVPLILTLFKAIVSCFAAAYARYSCDNSSPTSILDQVASILNKAKEKGRFIPWEFVFADYSVSGLDSGRRAYLNCKALIDHPDRVIDTLYIDDFSRASRDSLEWWKLGWFCMRRRLGMIGASDGFDLSSPNWDIWITIYGLLSRLFIRGLQEKVSRGMKGAAKRRTCLGKPPMGFTRSVVRDVNGNPVVRANGKVLYEWAVDPVSREFVEQLFKLFVNRQMSAYEITRLFNQQLIEGTDTLTESTIKKMLWNPAYSS